MKGKIQNRLEEEDKRCNLGEILPLSTPFVLMIDPSSACNHRCIFCPTGNIKLIRSTKRYVGVMNLEKYKKIIDSVNSFQNPIKVLRLYKVGEPLVNRNLSEMIEYAKKNKNIERIDTTTNGVLLSPTLNKRLIKAGINQINISVNGVNTERIFHFTKTKLNFDSYVKNIKHLYEIREGCTIYIKAIKQNLTTEEQNKFFEIFGNYSDRIFLENLSPAWPDFELPGYEPTEGHYGQEVIERQVCPYLFYTMVVNADGKVSTCVQDWKQNMILGDTDENSLKDIWLSKAATEYRLRHLQGEKSYYETCKNCLVMKYGVIENIDLSANLIRDKLLSGKF